MVYFADEKLFWLLNIEIFHKKMRAASHVSKLASKRPMVADNLKVLRRLRLKGTS